MQTHTGPWAARPESRLIVLLSSERSGSTLLRVMLGEHRRIVAPQEMFLLRYPDFDAWRARKPVAMESALELFLLLGQPTSDAAIDAACRGRSTVDVYRWLFDRMPPGLLLLDKTPAYANDPAALARSAALAPFYVWLIRHPLGVIDSHVRLKAAQRRRRPLARRVLHPLRDAVERWTGGLTAIARERETKWVVQNHNLRNFLRHVPLEQKAVVHFEDLVRAPEPIVRTLCAAIGIEPEPGMVRPETRRVMNPHLGDPNFHLHGGIDAQPAESWAARYNETQLRTETLQLMQQIGIPSPRLRQSRDRAA
jgi:hypothetical protein